MTTTRRHDPADEEAVCADHLMVMQNALERADGGLQERHVKNALVPDGCLETFDAPFAIAAGKTQGQILLLTAEKAYAKTTFGKDRIVRFRT